MDFSISIHGLYFASIYIKIKTVSIGVAIRSYLLLIRNYSKCFINIYHIDFYICYVIGAIIISTIKVQNLITEKQSLSKVYTAYMCQSQGVNLGTGLYLPFSYSSSLISPYHFSFSPFLISYHVVQLIYLHSCFIFFLECLYGELQIDYLFIWQNLSGVFCW